MKRWTSVLTITSFLAACDHIIESTGTGPVGVIVGKGSGNYIGRILSSPDVPLQYNGLRVWFLPNFPEDDWVLYNKSESIYFDVD